MSTIKLVRSSSSLYTDSSDSSGGVKLPMDESDDENEAAMQQMMGFSSFGTADKDKRASKRQKLNSGEHGLPTKPPATAGNSTPLGKRSTTMSASTIVPASLPPQHPVMSTEGQNSIMSTSNKRVVDTVTAAEEAIVTPNTETAHDPLPASYPLPASPAPKDSHQKASLAAVLNPSTTDLPPQPPTSDTTTTSTANATASTIYTASDIRSNPSYWTNTPDKPPTTANTNAHTHAHTNRRAKNTPRLPYPDNDEIGYTNPDSGKTMTNRQLNEYHVGKDKVQADGSVVKVYFKPSFLEDPWAEFN